MKYKFLSCILLCGMLPLFSACNDTDDVSKIFLAKTWKMTNVFVSAKNPATDYWETKEDRYASIALMEEEGNCYLTFNGVPDGSNISGTYNGHAISSASIKGNWMANGKNNNFSTSDQVEPTEDMDVLEQVFMWALVNAYKYEGDENNLRIYFYDPISEKNRFILFKPN